MSDPSQENPWQTLSESEVYTNPWIRVEHHEVINPSGNPGIYGLVHFKHLAIGIVPLDEHDNTWLVGQYRYPNREYTWEIPEGGGKLDVTPLESAKRELLEETGITANQWTEICTMRLSNSATDETAYLFVARDLQFGESQPEETEQLTIRKVPFAEAFQLVMDGTITDSMSVAAILKTKILLDSGEV